MRSVEQWVAGFKSFQDLGLSDEVESLKVLLRRETSSYLPCENYLSKQDSFGLAGEPWRRNLCQWAFSVADHFKFDREVVSFALNYLDRTAASKATVPSKHEFQFLAVSCLYLAVKVHGEVEQETGPRRKLSLDAYVSLSRGLFKKEDIEKAELNILSCLKWKINPPTCLRFIDSLLSLMPKWNPNEHSCSYSDVVRGISDFARYLTELALCVSTVSCTNKASTTAFCAIVGAIDALESTHPLPYGTRALFFQTVLAATGLSHVDIEVRRLVSTLKQLCPTSFAPNEVLAEAPEPTNNIKPGSGTTSPVCVIEQTHDTSERPGRKRSREMDEHARTNRPAFYRC
jgi:hypothetical protein